MNILIALLLSIAHAQNQDTWLCTEESLIRSGTAYEACGVGEGMDEGEARSRALNHAIADFKAVCDLSSNCKGRGRDVEPMRTTCAVNNGWWKCYRLIRVSLD